MIFSEMQGCRRGLLGDIARIGKDKRQITHPSPRTWSAGVSYWLRASAVGIGGRTAKWGENAQHTISSLSLCILKP